ncbi:conserved Plasmodium protein, unknown function [Plasmodium malariae]|uniref:Uncharacterized protein n=1 Tax=Plasmodium malariae TaxID=5858 RepID=A0A1C3KES9_PLAMA|nr:conserved Plasmodium protein, unknown function [Plasmodium malariae]
MNDNKKLDIIRSMLNALLGGSESQDRNDEDNDDENNDDENNDDENNDDENNDDNDNNNDDINNNNNNYYNNNNNGTHGKRSKHSKSKLKKIYIEKSKKAIFFYRNYMNILEQQELEKFSNLYDIILNNSFEYSEKDNIDTYMYCNVFPILKKTFDSFVLYISKLVTHKNDENYKKIIKNLDPILLFSQYIIRLTDDDFSLSADDDMFEMELNDNTFQPKNKFIYENEHNNSCNYNIISNTLTSNSFIPMSEHMNSTTNTGIDKEISDFYNKYDTLVQENKLKEKQKKQEILKNIYDKKNVLSQEEISLYDMYYEENINFKERKFRVRGTSSVHLDLNELSRISSFQNMGYGDNLGSTDNFVDGTPNAFNISLDLKAASQQIKYASRNEMKNEAKVVEKKFMTVQEKSKMVDHAKNKVPIQYNEENPDEEFNYVIKQLERKESSYFEKKIYLLLNKWIKEEDGRRFIINQKSKIEPLFNDFKKKNYTVTDKDIIPLLFFIDKNLYLNYSLVHQYNYSNFYYIFHLHSSFYCSDTNSITFDEVWNFLVSNLPLNNYLYKEDILIGLEKFRKKKEIIKNFHFTITIIKNFLILLLMDIFLFFSDFIKTELLNSNENAYFVQTEQLKVPLSNSFYLHMNSFSTVYSSSSSASSILSASSATHVEMLSNIEHPSTGNKQNGKNNDTLKGVDHTTMDEGTSNTNDASNRSENISADQPKIDEKNVDDKEETKNCGRRKNLLMYFLLLLWGVNIKLNFCPEEFMISGELSTDADEEEEEGEEGEEEDKEGDQDEDRKEKQDEDKKEDQEKDRSKHHNEKPNGVSKEYCKETSKIEEKSNREQGEESKGEKIKSKNGSKIHEKYKGTYKKEKHKYICHTDSNTSINAKYRKGCQKTRSLSLNQSNNSNKRLKSTKKMEKILKNKEKIDINELRNIKKRKEAKRFQGLYHLRKRYKEKEYSEHINKLIHSIVKNIKPKRKNYYNQVVYKLENDSANVFLNILQDNDVTKKVSDMHVEINERNEICSSGKVDKDKEHPHVNSSDIENHSNLDNRDYIGVTSFNKNNWHHNSFDKNNKNAFTHCFSGIFNEKQTVCLLENFVKTYIKKKKKKKKSLINSNNMINAFQQNIEPTSIFSKGKNKVQKSILLLCNFKLYKKKFLNKFNIDHIYLLLFFVCYIKASMDDFFNCKQVL